MSSIDSLQAAAAATSAADALDAATFAEVEGLLGEASAARMLERLRCDIAERLTDELVSRAEGPEIASAAHAIVSASGLLGFSALSKACAELERACRQDAPIKDALTWMIFERDRALSLLAFRAAAATPAAA